MVVDCTKYDLYISKRMNDLDYSQAGEYILHILLKKFPPKI